jgi:hypothetical protein
MPLSLWRAPMTDAQHTGSRTLSSVVKWMASDKSGELCYAAAHELGAAGMRVS